MVRTYEKHIVEATTPTSTGTVDITVPVGATPVGCIVAAARVTAQSGPEAGLSMSWGSSDGTNTYCTSQRSEDAASTSDAGQSTTTDLLRLLDPASGSEDVVGELSTFITNGVRINFTTVDTVAYHYKVILVFGSDTEAHAFYAKPANPEDSSTAVSCGFEPSFVLTSSAGDDTVGTEQANANALFGIAANDGSSTMSCAGLMTETLQTTTDTRRAKYSNRLNVNVRLTTPALFGASTTIENYDADGFDVFTRFADFPKGIIGLAVRLPAGVSFTHLTNETFESSLGAATRSGLGFTPAFWYVCHSANSVDNDLSTAGSVSMGACDAALTQFSIAVMDQNNQTTSNSNSASNTKIHHVYAHGGATLEEAEITSRASGEYGLSIDDVAPTQRLYSILVVEEVPISTTIDAALVGMSTAIDAELRIDSSIAATVPAVASSITADQLFDATITGPLGSLGAALDADQLFDATITAGLGGLNASIDADQLLDATIAAALGSLNTSIDADQLFDATITAGLGAVSASIDADQLLDATITAALGSLGAALDTDQLLDATIAAGLSTLSADLTADQLLDATIAAGLSTLSADLTADQRIDATITAALGSLNVDLDADHDVIGTITAGLAAMVSSLDVEVDTDVDAEITAALGSLNGSLETDQLLDATITAGLSTLDADLDVEHFLGAVINAPLGSLAAALAAEELLDATITAPLSALNAILRESVLLLGCDVALLGSKATRSSLLGSSDQTTAMLASSNIRDPLLGSSDATVDLSGSSDRIVDLGGSHC